MVTGTDNGPTATIIYQAFKADQQLLNRQQQQQQQQHL